MGNSFDTSLPPQDALLNPWQDGGIAFLAEPEFIWREVTPATIEGFAASEHDEINTRINAILRNTKTTRRLGRAFEYESVPVMLSAASFWKSFVFAQDRVVLSGAAGTRALNHYRRQNLKADTRIDTGLDRYFAQCKAENETLSLPQHAGLIEQDTAFAISCRNTFNYFHFTTEALCQLTLMDGMEFQGEIFFHYPNHDDKTRPFTKAFVEALFPEFAGRVHFERCPKEYDQVITGYDLLNTYPYAPDGTFADLKRRIGKNVLDDDARSDLANARIIAANGYSTALMSLRKRGLEAIADHDFSHLPKRFFVGRDDRKSRVRHMGGEDLLIEHLQLFGFEYVVFESLSPLEQIALMAQAEMMVSYHGAGFANMMFARPDAYVVELGTLQTAQYRWEDFWPMAHVSGCRYINFFCDFLDDDPMIEPDFKKDGIVPVSLSETAVAQVMAFIVTVLGHEPELKSPDKLLEVGRAVLAADAPERAIALLDRHAEMIPYNLELCLFAADCHKKLEDPKNELVALDQAYKADRNRWQTLIRIIWCANHCDRPQVIRWALSRLEVDFPDRYSAFIGKHEWVRYVA